MVEIKYWPTYNGKIRQNIIIVLRKEHPVNRLGLLTDLLLQGNFGLRGTLTSSFNFGFIVKDIVKCVPQDSEILGQL